MRHRNVGLKLNRSSSHRDAMFRNMVTSLLKHERIRTTDVKAKELRRWADHVITLAKRGDLHARRQAMAIVYEKDVVHKLFEEANAKFGNRQGGYTRIVKLGFRAGDAAPVSMVELVYDEPAAKPAAKKAAPKAAKTAAAPVAAETAATETKAPETAEEAPAPVEEAPAAASAETEEQAAAAVEEAASEDAADTAEAPDADAPTEGDEEAK